MIPSNDFNTFNDAPAEPEPLSWSQAWVKALFSPSVETYTRIAYDPEASTWRAGTWLFLATLVGTLIGTPLTLLFNPAQMEPIKTLVGETGADMLVGIAGLMLCLLPLAALFSVIGGMISAAIYQLIAGLLGGRGDFTAMFMAFSAFSAPIAIISSIASSIPYVNLCVGLPLALYALVLSVIAVQAVNRFGTGKAILTILLPTLAISLCCCLTIFALSASLAPIMGDPANWQKILTPQS